MVTSRPVPRRRAAAAAVLLLATMLQPVASPTAAAAATGGRLPKPKPIASAGGPDITAPNRIAPDPSAKLDVTSVPAVRWPAAGRADLDLGGTRLAGAWVTAPGLPVAVAPVAAGRTATLAGGLPARVRVQLAAPAGASARPVVLRVSSLGAGGPVRVRVDYSGFAPAFGGDWAARLRLVSLPECALTTPDAAGCGPRDLATVNDGRTVAATVTLAPVATSLASGGGQVVALVAGASSSGGDYTATPLQASSTWTAGGQAGDFTWSYPMRMPPSLGGPSPVVGLSYSSQAVDGMTSAANSQPTWIGEGFSFEPGSITRSYKGCADDGQTGDSDECWFSDNATLSMSGHGGELIPDATVPNLWHPKNDDGTRVEKLTGAVNGDNDGEYWRVTTTDGMQYYFGLNRLPGWTAGKPTTASTLTMPVFGNNAGEPCHASTFAASYCDQAYQWNLDYVVDPHHNTASYWYAPELNHYARNHVSTSVSAYVRGATLARVDYGTRQDGGVDSDYSAGVAPQRVVLGVADRCVTPGATCVPDAAHASNWPDVPWDQQCDSSTSCPNVFSPVMFTQKMLATVTTQVWSGTGTTYGDVELWTLHHVFKDPQDGYTKILWLSGISHAGERGTTITTPDITFGSTLTNMNNRVDTASLDPIIRFRMASILTDSGAQINIGYSAQECVKGTNMPATPDSNTKRCFPVYWTPPGQSAPTLDWFHKYLVANVTVVNTSEAGTAPDSYAYAYIGAPAWHYDEGEFVIDSRKTWGQWRGYRQVRVTHGQGGTVQSQSDTIFFQGMNGDHLASGATRAVTIPADPDFGGAAINDEPWWQGQARESIAYNGTGDAAPVVSKALNTPWQYGPTATRTRNGLTVNAYLTGTKTTTTKTALDGGRGWRTTATTNTFDAEAGLAVKVGRIVRQDDQGDTATTADDRCVRTTYAENAAAWFVTATAETETVGVNCAATPDRSVDILTDERTWYDGATSFGTTIGAGNVTRSERLANWNGGSPVYQTTGRAAQDTYGRVTDAWDALDHHSTTAYTPASGAPVTSTTVTNPMGWATVTTVDPAWGLPTATVDPNGHRTDLAYDGLGRLTASWLPGRSKATQSASQKFAYYVRNDGFPNAVVTSALTTDGTGYIDSYALSDSLLRARQTQKPAPGGGRILTDTFYDSQGRGYLVDSPYYSAASPGILLAAPSTVPASTLTTYDAAGRSTAVIFRVDGAERWRTTSTFGGDRVDLTPPAGGTPTSTFTDARGQSTVVRQYHGTTTTGAYDTTTTTYTRAGDKATVVDPAGNTWRFSYDQQGRRLTADDPDTGHTSFTYDAVGEVLTSTDARGVTLVTTYDALGRRTAEYSGSVAPANLRAAWTYDTLAKGQTTSSTRYVGGATGSAYVDAVTGYDAMYRTTGTSIAIPAAEGALAGTYTYASTYNADGSAATLTLPAAGTGGGRLAAETVTYGYNSLGMPTTVTGLSNYVAGTDYDSLGNQISVTETDGTRTLNEIWAYEYGTNRLAEHGVQDPDLGTVYEDTYYTDNDAGYVTSAKNETAQYGAGPDDNQCFRYDYLRRLSDAWTPGSGDCAAGPSVAGLAGPAPYWQSWTFDLTGNRLTQTDHATAGNTVRTSTYPAATAVRPHAVTQVVTTPPAGGATTDAYTYDAVGGTTTRTLAGHPAQTLTWDAEGHVASVADSTGTTGYVYDAAGDRLIARDPAGATLFLPDQDLRATGTSVVATRMYGANATRTAAGGVYWLVNDYHQSNEMAIRASDLTVSRRYSKPYGEARATAPAWPTTRGFVGGTVDATGLSHTGAREYEPANGRFISADSVDQTGSPQLINGYAYGDNAPTTQSDPSGKYLHAEDESGTPTCDTPYMTPGNGCALTTTSKSGFDKVSCSGDVGSMSCSASGPHCPGIVLDGHTCLTTTNVPQLHPQNGDGPNGNHTTASALADAYGQGATCELGTYQIVCYGAKGVKVGDCQRSDGMDCVAQTQGDVMLWPGTRAQFIGRLNAENDKRTALKNAAQAAGIYLDVDNVFGPNLEKHEENHSLQYTHYGSMGDFGESYGWQQWQSNSYCGDYGICNKFEVTANPYQGGYWTVEIVNGKVAVYADVDGHRDYGVIEKYGWTGNTPDNVPPGWAPDPSVTRPEGPPDYPGP